MDHLELFQNATVKVEFENILNLYIIQYKELISFINKIFCVEKYVWDFIPL